MLIWELASSGCCDAFPVFVIWATGTHHFQAAHQESHERTPWFDCFLCAWGYNYLQDMFWPCFWSQMLFDNFLSYKRGCLIWVVSALPLQSTEVSCWSFDKIYASHRLSSFALEDDCWKLLDLLDALPKKGYFESCHGNMVAVFLVCVRHDRL